MTLKELIDLASEMRKAQNSYFWCKPGTAKAGFLKESKKLEAQLDKAILEFVAIENNKLVITVETAEPEGKVFLGNLYNMRAYQIAFFASPYNSIARADAMNSARTLERKIDELLKLWRKYNQFTVPQQDLF